MAIDFTHSAALALDVTGDGVVAAADPALSSAGKRQRRLNSGERRWRLTLVLNSTSQAYPVFLHVTVEVSPSSSVILPTTMPRAYMLGICNQESKAIVESQVVATPPRGLRATHSDSILSILGLLQQGYPILSIHQRGSRVAQEFRLDTASRR